MRRLTWATVLLVGAVLAASWVAGTLAPGELPPPIVAPNPRVPSCPTLAEPEQPAPPVPAPLRQSVYAFIADRLQAERYLFAGAGRPQIGSLFSGAIGRATSWPASEEMWVAACAALPELLPSTVYSVKRWTQKPLRLTRSDFGVVLIDLTKRMEGASRVSQIGWSLDLRQALLYIEDVRGTSWRGYFLLLERGAEGQWAVRREHTMVWVN